MSSAPTSPAPLVSPDCIAAGIGLAERREICGLLAMLEATSALKLAQSVISGAGEKLGIEVTPAGKRMKEIAETLFASSTSTDILRHRLWLETTRALSIEALLPLSVRKAREAAAAIGVRAAEVLAPGIIARQEEKRSLADPSTGEGLLNTAKRFAAKMTGKSGSVSLRFPDIVVAELDEFLNGLRTLENGGDIDPAIAEAIRKGQNAMAAAAASGGGWAAFATVVGSAGFAPYIFAAQLSAFIPFVSGPALVSFLAVMINPVTVAVGVAAVGAWAVKGQANAAQVAVASRLAVLLALRGMQQPEEGIAALVSSFRSLPRLPSGQAAHLTQRELEHIREKSRRTESKLKRPLPAAHGQAPGAWSELVDRHRQPAFADTAAVGAIMAGDMLFHAAAIDPAVLSAADFSRNLDLNNAVDLAAHISAFVSKGALIGLRGYTAEQVVLAKLIDLGHSASLAPDSVTPGFDLIVDGCEVQVKCGTSLSLLEEHFSKYPEIPVIADVGLAQLAELSSQPWSHLVTTVDGFELDVVEALVAKSLDAAASLSAPDLPIFAAIVGAARGSYKAWAGEIAVADLPAWLVVDLSIRGGLAAAGKVGGASIGLLAIGPAGAVVLGPVIGVAALLGTGHAHSLLERAIHADWHGQLMLSVADLHRALTAALNRQIDELLRRQEELEAASTSLPQELQAWLNSRALDDAVGAVEALEEVRAAKDVNGAMELLVQGGRHAPFDKEVARARAQVIAELNRKSSTTEAGGAILRKVFGMFRRGASLKA